MSTRSRGRLPEPPAGEGALRGPGRVQTAHVGGGAAVLEVMEERRAFPGGGGGWKEGGPPGGGGSRQFPRSSAASPASWRAVRGPCSGKRLWDPVAQVPRRSGLDLVSEVGMVLK